MSRLYIFVLLAATAFALDAPCKEGVDINTHPMKDADYMIGNWSFTYHWLPTDKVDDVVLHFDSSDSELTCPQIEILPVTPDLVEEKQSKCGNDLQPFDWEDAKLKVTAPFMSIKDGVIFMGKEKNYLMVDCEKVVRIEAMKVSEDTVVLVNPESSKVSEMLSRKPLMASELECLVRNIDIGKGFGGVSVCY